MRLTAGYAMAARTDESWTALQAVQALCVLSNWT